MVQGSPEWTLGPLRFDPDGHDAHGVQWFLVEEEGFWGSPGTDADVSPRMYQHGVYRNPGWKKERIISLTGHAYADDMSFATLRRAAHRVSSLLSDPDSPVDFTCHSEIGNRTCEVFLDGDILTQPVESATPALTWSLQLVAPDPRLYHPAWHRMSVGLPRASVGDGLDFTEGTKPDQGLNFSQPVLDRTGWTATANTAASGSGPENALDGDPLTHWHSKWGSVDPFPHHLTVDMQAVHTIGGLRHHPRADGQSYPNIGQYEVRVSTDGTTFSAPIASGTFPNDQKPKEVWFPSAVPARYVRLTALSEASNAGIAAAVAELYALHPQETVKNSGLRFGSKGEMGLLTLLQSGTAPAPVVFTLHGPLDTPTLACHTGGRDYKLTYNGTLAKGEFVVIDPAEKSVLLQNHASRRELLHPAQFAGFEIPAAGRQRGQLRIGLSHKGPWTPGYLDVDFREAFF